MKILLAAINAKYIHSNPAVYSLKAFVQAYDKREGKLREPAGDIEIAEFTINHQTDVILREIYRKKPGILAFSCYIWNLEIIEKLIENLPGILPDTQIWLGGPEVSYDAEAFLKRHPGVRGIMTGEGEETFCELVSLWRAGRESFPKAGGESLSRAGGESFSKVRGIVYKNSSGEVITTPLRPPLSMDTLPFPYGDIAAFENRIVYYESSRGCPFSCSYCLSSIDRTQRFRSTETVKRELQFFLDRRVPQVKFVDRTFNSRHEHSMEIWNYIKEHDNGITNFHFEIAADLLKEDEIELLGSLRPGLVQLEIGVQSTNLQTLREIRRISDFERLAGIVRKLAGKHNIHIHLDLIAGLPFEDYESFVRSFNDVYALHPEQLQLGFLKVLKGSAMYQKAGEYGLCYHGTPPYEVFFSRWISYDEILKLKDTEEMLEVYYNSGQFANTLRRLEREFAHPFAMFEELAEFYKRSTKKDMKFSRIARLELLRRFIHEKSKDPVYEELLTLDLYLRENSKSRPDWSPDLSKRKEEILKFYQREERRREILRGYEGRSAKQMMHMTHIECFTYAFSEEGFWQEKWILFDYQKRDPLSQNVAVRDVTEEFLLAKHEASV
ncbi:MAG: B12-binding domain-containing radical SAM protein [Eubacteriales bacterium]|nr:B12-binding domain-containing radical SAM protein [Eubacteriales bacterium]